MKDAHDSYAGALNAEERHTSPLFSLAWLSLRQENGSM
jgi:hypothetical protein